MRILKAPHKWGATPKEAVAIQKRLCPLVRQTKPSCSIRIVAGVDAAFSIDGTRCLAGVVLWDIKDKSIVEKQTAALRVNFPYIPGLLSFREAPAILKAFVKLEGEPDALICDGQGIAHPRGFGLACHLGIITALPTIGCAKSRLLGKYCEPAEKRGSRTPLLDHGEEIGTVLRTRDRVKPVFVSVGHNIDLPTAEQVILECGTGYRLPEPTRQADRLVSIFKHEWEAKRDQGIGISPGSTNMQ